MIKGVAKTIKNKAKDQKGGFLNMLLGTLGAILLGDLLTGKEQLELVNAWLEQAKTFNAATSFNKFWNTKVLSKWT